MNANNDPWQRLASVARRAEPAKDDSHSDDQPPFGMSARIVARWKESRQAEGEGGLEWIYAGWRILAVASAVALICVALNYKNLQPWTDGGQDVAVLSGVEVSL
jgi:hypothetical protein